MIIIYAKGIVDTTGCRLHIVKGDNSSAHSELPATDEGYNLMLTNLETGLDFVIQHCSSEVWANGILNGIIKAIKRGAKYYDLTASLSGPNEERT